MKKWRYYDDMYWELFLLRSKVISEIYNSGIGFRITRNKIEKLVEKIFKEKMEEFSKESKKAFFEEMVEDNIKNILKDISENGT